MVKKCIVSEIFNTTEINANPAADTPTGHALATTKASALFQISSTRLYVPVANLSINNNIKFQKT